MTGQYFKGDQLQRVRLHKIASNRDAMFTPTYAGRCKTGTFRREYQGA